MKATIFGLLVLAPASIWGSSSAVSEELQPLSQWLKRPANQQDPSYSFVRCAGYYMAIMKYAGARLSNEEKARVVEVTAELAFAAAEIRRAKAPSTLPLKEYVAGDVSRTADEYGMRMQRNYSLFGDAAADDSLITGDGQACKEIVKELSRR